MELAAILDARVGVAVDGDRLPNRLELDAHVPDSRSAHREGGGEQHGRIKLAKHGPEPAGDVHVGGNEDPGLIEHRQQTGGPQRELGVEGIPPVATGPGRHRLPRSSRSLTAATSPRSGCQVQTPHGTPATRGASGPSMPRTNR
jgi:hypothetical protein